MAFKFQIEEATRTKAKLRMALSGPGGAGKTKSALKIARSLVGPDGKIAVADTEFESASKYAPARGKAPDNEETFSFLRIPISGNYDPRQIPDLVSFVVSQGVDILIIDSMTHFWNGSGGFLELVDAEVKRMKAQGYKGDSFAAWKEIDPHYKRMIAALLGAPLHIICTLRAKTEYEKTQGDGNTKGKVTKLGMAPEMRDHFQYEMDIEGMLNMEHDLVIGKTRCSALDGKVFHRPGADVAAILRGWLDDGEAPAARAAETPAMSDAEIRRAIGDELDRLGITEQIEALAKQIGSELDRLGLKDKARTAAVLKAAGKRPETVDDYKKAIAALRAEKAAA